MITVPGIPVPKGRPRASRTRCGVHMRTPDRTVEYEHRVAMYARHVGRIDPDGVALAVHVLAVLPRPQRLCRRADPDGLMWATSAAADVDNIAKAVLDGLQLAGVLADDRHVVEVHAVKCYAEKGGQPRTLIRWVDVTSRHEVYGVWLAG